MALLRLFRFLLFLFLGCIAPLHAEVLHGDLQVYPAGIIAGPALMIPLDDRTLWGVRVAYNATDRRDFGEHDDETGGGPGVGLIGRQYFGPVGKDWFYGARLDLWFLDIDWEEGDRSGSTEVVVLQPTIEGGYTWVPADDWFIDLSLSVGAEINVDSSGEDVGEGAIGLLGLGVTRLF